MRFGNKPVLDDVPDEGSELHSVNTQPARDCNSIRQIQTANGRLDHFAVLHRSRENVLFRCRVLYSA